MLDSVTYAHLDRALKQLGFQQTERADGTIGYRHEATDTVVLFKPHSPKDMVPKGTLAATRRLLVERGLVGAEEWVDMLHSVAA